MNTLATRPITTIEIVLDSTLPAEKVLAAAHDFSIERRSKMFSAVQKKYFIIHEVGDTWADVTEGTRAGPIVNWERCRYDWSQPGSVTATVTNSNVYAIPGSSWTITAAARDDATDVELIW